MSTLIDPTPAAAEAGSGPAAPSAPAPIEDRMLKIINPGAAQAERAAQQPRENGKFAKPQPAPSAEAQPAPEAQEQSADGAQPAAAAEGEQATEEQDFAWESIKDTKLKIPMKNGEKEWEEELTLEHLRAGHMMQSDYTRKMQELARQRSEAETQMRAHVDGQREQYLAALQGLQQVIVTRMAPEIANANWSELANNNPSEFVRLTNRKNEVVAALNAVQVEQQKVIEQQSKERRQALDKAIADARTKIASDIPEWSDDLYQSLLKRSVETYGFTPQEAGQWFDPRIMRILHDAHQYHVGKAAKPATPTPVDKKVNETPRALKPGAAPQKPPQSQAEFQAARTKLKQSGHLDDAASAFRAMLQSQNRRR